MWPASLLQTSSQARSQMIVAGVPTAVPCRSFVLGAERDDRVFTSIWSALGGQYRRKLLKATDVPEPLWTWTCSLCICATNFQQASRILRHRIPGRTVHLWLNGRLSPMFFWRPTAQIHTNVVYAARLVNLTLQIDTGFLCETHFVRFVRTRSPEKRQQLVATDSCTLGRK